MIWILSAILAFSLEQGEFLNRLIETPPCPTCTTGVYPQEEKNLMVFMSFSMPLESWKDLSVQLEKTEGVFIVKGIPDDSFEQLAEKIIELRAADVNAPINIDPESFEKYEIEAVPAFVLEDGEKSDRVVGNIRLDAALREMAEKGDTFSKAKEILQHLDART